MNTRNATGLCHCGCGLTTPLAWRSRKEKGWIKGEPLRYIAGHGGVVLGRSRKLTEQSPLRGVDCKAVTITCHKCGNRMEIPQNLIGVRKYCSRKCSDQSKRSNNPYKYRRITVNGIRVLEHRWIMEEHLGRKLLPTEHVDHINRIKSDNRIENLRVVDICVHGSISCSQRGIPVEEVPTSEQWVGVGVTGKHRWPRRGIVSSSIEGTLRTDVLECGHRVVLVTYADEGKIRRQRRCGYCFESTSPSTSSP